MKKYLIEKAASMGIEMSAEQAEKFEAYNRLIYAINGEMNLTRVENEITEACDRNYLDSLTALKYLGNAEKVADVGSGAGFPGVPLAIMRPDIRFTLFDALGKRVDFLNRVISKLALNAEAVHIRSEDAAKKPEYRDAFDVATARAVADMRVLSEWLLPFVKQGGCMLALKGPDIENELKDSEYALELLCGKLMTVDDADIPGRGWQHKIAVIEKTAPTPANFPRKAGMAEKRPLIRK